MGGFGFTSNSWRHHEIDRAMMNTKLYGRVSKPVVISGPVVGPRRSQVFLVPFREEQV
ncbi:hypothetical protein HETIRDRAFT_309304 [Heterobasidion irregulare TC 32-1]|uniref:Uncharacterized protein n=1 Tax=Heterobasidion irregulare (strain TC 32-1) TaxID=747525 RepID=W4KKK7_HETIT|nr:uncharacterized protein HETIRDRAFT_309304 [Heterobasidion irregulare TC 32-1]ETW85601.1 hypothetical protein HETIRDRAFT_309304 [Heterobasidion irregulare TC 32-1]